MPTRWPVPGERTDAGAREQRVALKECARCVVDFRESNLQDDVRRAAASAIVTESG
jgi:hypothetical protein